MPSKTRKPLAESPTIPEELIDQFVTGPMAPALPPEVGACRTVRATIASLSRPRAACRPWPTPRVAPQ